jgi:hypothetical protein
VTGADFDASTRADRARALKSAVDTLRVAGFPEYAAKLKHAKGTLFELDDMLNYIRGNLQVALADAAVANKRKKVGELNGALVALALLWSFA